jgi:hypothetical protein
MKRIVTGLAATAGLLVAGAGVAQAAPPPPSDTGYIAGPAPKSAVVVAKGAIGGDIFVADLAIRFPDTFGGCAYPLFLAGQQGATCVTRDAYNVMEVGEVFYRGW